MLNSNECPSNHSPSHNPYKVEVKSRCLGVEAEAKVKEEKIEFLQNQN